MRGTADLLLQLPGPAMEALCEHLDVDDIRELLQVCVYLRNHPVLNACIPDHMMVPLTMFAMDENRGLQLVQARMMARHHPPVRHLMLQQWQWQSQFWGTDAEELPADVALQALHHLVEGLHRAPPGASLAAWRMACARVETLDLNLGRHPTACQTTALLHLFSSATALHLDSSTFALPAQLSALDTFARVTELHVSTLDHVAMSEFAHIAQLRTLAVEVRGSEDQAAVWDAGQLAALSGLQELSLINHACGLRGLHALRRHCTALWYLDLKGVRHDPTDVGDEEDATQQWLALKTVRLSKVPSSLILAARLDAAPQLAGLHLFDIDYGTPACLDAALRSLCRLPAGVFTRLTVKAPGGTRACHLAALSSMPRLTALALWADDADVDMLAGVLPPGLLRLHVGLPGLQPEAAQAAAHALGGAVARAAKLQEVHLHTRTTASQGGSCKAALRCLRPDLRATVHDLPQDESPDRSVWRLNQCAEVRPVR